MRTELVAACLAMTAVTYLCRALLTVSVARVKVPAPAERFLSLIPFAVLTALVTPYLLTPGESTAITLLNPALTAGVATFFVAWKRRSLLAAVITGMALYLLLGLVA